MRGLIACSSVLLLAGCLAPRGAAGDAFFESSSVEDQPLSSPPPVDDGFARLQKEWQDRDEQQRAQMLADSQRQLDEAQQRVRDEQQREAEDTQRRAQQEQADAANQEWLQREQQLILTPMP